MQGKRTMGNGWLIWAWTAVALLGGVEPALAGGAQVDGDVNSAYVWRGITFNNGPVIQPSAGWDLPGGLGLNAWANYDVDNYPGVCRSGAFSEVDVVAFYRLPFRALDLKVGAVEYMYHRKPAVENKGEAFASAGVKVGPVGLVTEFYHGFRGDEDYYGTVGANHGIELTDILELQLAGLLGYAGGDMRPMTGSGGWHDYLLSVSLNYTGIRRMVLGLSAAYTDRLRRSAYEADEKTYGGIHAGYRF